MARFRASRALVIATLTAAGAAPPAAAAILFQQTVTPVNGAAGFSIERLLPKPGVIWIGIDGGRLTSGKAMFFAEYFGQFWYPVFDDSELGEHPELYTENYYTENECISSIGSSYCSTRFAYSKILFTRMNGRAFEVDWRGYKPYNNCFPFSGYTGNDCSAFGFHNQSDRYQVAASAAGPVTFTVYDTDPTNGTIPEPASWAMLIAGFGLTGAVLRRRRGLVFQEG